MKRLNIVITFPNTHSVMCAESTLHSLGLPGEVANVPPAISAGCGLCLRLPQTVQAQVLAQLNQQNIAMQDCYLEKNGCYTKIENEKEI